MEFIDRHFALLIYLVGVIAALVVGWRLYKEGYLAEFGQTDRWRAAEAADLAPVPAPPAPADPSRHLSENPRKKRISRKSILIVAVIVCGGIGIWLANHYRPAPEISNGDAIDRYRYAFIAFSIGIFAAAYCYSRKIWLSIMSAALLFIPLLGLLYFLNATLDTPYKTSYLISDKYEKRVRGDDGYYTIYYLEGIDEDTERATLFSSARGDFDLRQYRSMDLEADSYWMHVEEGEGFFDLLWRKEVLGIFDHPLAPPVEASINSSLPSTVKSTPLITSTSPNHL